MDELDGRLIGLLRKDGRTSLSDLATTLNIQRSTVRARLERLRETGEIVGFTVLTRKDVQTSPIRGLMMLAIAGGAAEKVRRMLLTMPSVVAVHSTNGTWDLIAEINEDSLEAFDLVLTRIRRLEMIARSETSLLLSTQR